MGSTLSRYSANVSGMSHRRLATLFSLAGLSALVVAMVAVRVAYTGSGQYGALVWNLTLAWVPFGLALLVYDGYRRGARRSRLGVTALLWLLFFPNAPYLVTDLKYLRTSAGAPIWYDVVLASAAAWAGLALGFISLYLMQAVARRLFGSLNAWVFVGGVLTLSSFGVYLGRFERWNSWDVFVRPGSLAADLWAGLSDPVGQVHAVAVTVLFTAFLAATYLVFYSFARAGLPEQAEL
jgi:uncharacterized membrane protein